MRLDNKTTRRLTHFRCTSHRRRCVLAAVFTMILCMAVLSACGAVQVTADLSAYGNMPIEIVGLQEESFYVTANELAKLPCVSQNASGRTAKAGNVQAVGPTLDAFLEQYGAGKQCADFTRIRFEASDGYKKGFLPDMLAKHTFVLSVANGDQPLNAQEAPLRLVIPGAQSNEWVRMVTRIEFVSEP